MRTRALHPVAAPIGHADLTQDRGGRPHAPRMTEARPGITHEQVVRRAHEIYLARGRGEGDALSDWLAAERELMGGARAMPRLSGRRSDERGH